MTDEIGVKIKADSSGVRSATKDASASIRDMSASARADARAMREELVRLNATLAQMQVQSKVTADAVSSASGFLDFAKTVGVLTAAYIGLQYAGDAVAAGFNRIQDSGKGLHDLLNNMASVRSDMFGVQTEMGGFAGSVANVFKGMSEGARVTTDEVRKLRTELAWSGTRTSLEGSVGSSTLDEGLTRYLLKIKEVQGASAMAKAESDKFADGIVSKFATLPGVTGPLLNELTSLTATIAKSPEEANALADALTRAMTDPLHAGDALLVKYGQLGTASAEQLAAAKETNNVSAGRAAVLNGVLARAREIAVTETADIAKKREAQGILAAIGDRIDGTNSSMLRLYNSTVLETNAHERTNFALATQLATFQQINAEVQRIVAGANSMTAQLNTLGSQKALLDARLNGPTSDAAAFVKKMENGNGGPAMTPYWDKSENPALSHWAIGNGQHSIGGQDVTKDSSFSPEQIEQDFRQRIDAITSKLAETLGDNWTKLSGETKASMTSATYNYGHTPDSVLAAAESGQDDRVAQALAALKSNPNRRAMEAANITSRGKDALSGDARDEALDTRRGLVDQELRLQAAKEGGSAIDKATVANIEAALVGKKDEVAAQKAIVDATEAEYRKAVDAGASEAEIERRKTAMKQAQTALDEKSFALKQADADLKISRIVDDPKALHDAKTEKAQATMDRYAPETTQYKAAVKEKEAADTEYETSKDRKSADDVNRSYRDELDKIAEKKAALQEEQQLGTVTRAQMFAGMRTLDEAGIALSQQHLEKMKAIYGEDSDEFRTAKLENEKTLRQSNLRMQQDTARSNAAIHQDYLGVATSITSSMSSSIMGMIQGTQNFQGMMRNISLEVIRMFLDAGLKMVANWAAVQMQKIVLAVTGEAQITAANAAGVAARLGITASGATAGAAVEKAANAATISGDAGKAAAGAYASAAQIPVIGWLLAPVAAAGAYAATMAFGSFDVGAWDIPQDQMAMVHKGELIMTANQGAAFRSALDSISGPAQQPAASARGGDTHVHLSPSAIDAGGVKSWLNGNSRQIARALDRAVRNGDTLGLRRLGA